MRPDFYGREAIAAFHDLVHQAGGRLQLGELSLAAANGGDQAGVLSEASVQEVLDRWRGLNSAAWGQAKQHAGIHIAHTSRAAADAYWHWQVGLNARRRQFGDACWLPELLWLRSSTSRRAMRVVVWGEGQAQAFPEAELAMYMPPPLKAKRPAIMIPQEEVLGALDDLVTTARAADGLDVRYVPEGMDAECRHRAAALTEGRDPVDLNLFEPVEMLLDA